MCNDDISGKVHFLWGTVLSSIIFLALVMKILKRKIRVGTPKYWLWVGRIFSALEPVPILFMVIDTLRDVREKKTEIENKIALYWAVGCAVLHRVL